MNWVNIYYAQVILNLNKKSLRTEFLSRLPPLFERSPAHASGPRHPFNLQSILLQSNLDPIWGNHWIYGVGKGCKWQKCAKSNKSSWEIAHQSGFFVGRIRYLILNWVKEVGCLDAGGHLTQSFRTKESLTIIQRYSCRYTNILVSLTTHNPKRGQLYVEVYVYLFVCMYILPMAP